MFTRACFTEALSFKFCDFNGLFASEGRLWIFSTLLMFQGKTTLNSVPNNGTSQFIYYRSLDVNGAIRGRELKGKFLKPTQMGALDK